MTTSDELAAQSSAVQSLLVFPPPVDRNVSCAWRTGGRLLTHVQLCLLFWGSGWTGNANPAMQDIVTAAGSMLASPFMSGLSQYGAVGTPGGTIGQGGLRAVALVTAPDYPDPPTPPQTFTDADLFQVIDHAIATQKFPPPTASNQLLYCVMLPAGTIYQGFPVGIGRHDSGPIDNVSCVPYALCTQPGGSLADLTALLSHELVEACSDAVLGTGVLCNSDQGQGRELADVCSGPGGERIYCGVNVQPYWSQRDQGCFLPDPPLSDAVAGTPSLIQGKFGVRGNFELVVPLAARGLVHYWRNNDVEYVPWNGATFFGVNDGTFDAATLIQSSFTEGPNIGNLEVIARQQGRLVHYWRPDQAPFPWIGPFGADVGLPIVGVSGDPSLIQGRFGTNRRNFEMVVPLASGGLAHFWRNNDLTFLWEQSAIFGQSQQFDAVTLIQSSFTEGSNIGNLEVIARQQGQLVHFWRTDQPPFLWIGPFGADVGLPTGGISGTPSLIQGRFGTNRRNFEMVAPLAAGGLAHFWRDNDTTFRWQQSTVFGQGRQFDAVTLLQSNFSAGGGIGNLEVIARTGNRLVFFWRDDTAPFPWHGPLELTG